MSAVGQYLVVNTLNLMIVVAGLCRLLGVRRRTWPGTALLLAALVALAAALRGYEELLPTAFLLPQTLYMLCCFSAPLRERFAAAAVCPTFCGALSLFGMQALDELGFPAPLRLASKQGVGDGEFLPSLCIILSVCALGLLLLDRVPHWRRLPEPVSGAVLLVSCAVTMINDFSRAAGRMEAFLWPVWAAAVATLAVAMIVTVLSERRDVAMRAGFLAGRRRLERDYRRELEDEAARLRRFCEQSIGQVRAVRAAVREGRAADAVCMLDELDRRVRAPIAAFRTGNPAVDALLRGKRGEADRVGCRLEASLDLSGCGGVSSLDIVCILSNLIDNALAAAKPGDVVAVSGAARCGLLVLQVQNPARGGERLPASFAMPARGRHGIGLASAQRAADQYDGSLTLAREGGFITARATLRLDAAH